MSNKKINGLITSFIAFAIIGTLNSCRDYHLNHQSKVGKVFDDIHKTLEFDNVFEPVDSIPEIDFDEKNSIIMEENHENNKKNTYNR